MLKLLDDHPLAVALSGVSRLRACDVVTVVVVVVHGSGAAWRGPTRCDAVTRKMPAYPGRFICGEQHLDMAAAGKGAPRPAFLAPCGMQPTATFSRTLCTP